MAYQKYLNAKIGLARRKIDKYDIDPSKRLQVADLLYNKLKLEVVSETDEGDPSTEKGALTQLKVEHPVVPAILEWRALDKLRGTYAEGLVKHIRDDGRIHPNLDVAGASSGRTSCKEPNLQNIPRTSDESAAMARNCFVAAPGRRILQLDYSQLEYRIAAMLSGDTVMTGMFQRGEDFHTATAKLIAQSYFNVHPDDITKEMRSQAKTFNFGLLFGMTDGGMSQRMGCTKAKAAELRKAIMGEWKELDAWIKRVLIESRESGFAYTMWEGEVARQRSLPLLGNLGDNWKASGLKRTAENSTNNTPVQGSASELCVMSLTECIHWLMMDDLDAKLILSVHDSLMFDVAEDDLDEVARTAHGIMTQWDLGDVPCVVDVEEGQSWGELKEYKVAA
jgi:DNA polymerase-1